MNAMEPNYEVFSREMERLGNLGNVRTLRQVEHDGKYIVDGADRLLNLSSNDYLGLAADNSLFDDFISSWQPSARQMSSSSARLLTGNSAEFGNLEAMLAEAFETQAALLFNSGYNMNMGILPAVCDSSTMILADRLVHASLIDGIRLSSAKCIRYRHLDYAQLEGLASKYAPLYSRIIIVTESLFSMDGDVADLSRLVGIKRRHSNIMLYVDEAHAIGVRGANGLGIAEEQGVIGDIDFLCGTFGKALCSVGAYIVCAKLLRDYLVNKVRPFIFTTALPPVNVAWTAHVFSRLSAFAARRKHLETISRKLREALPADCPCPSQSHIVPLVVGDSVAAFAKAEELQAKGFYVLPIRPPTVPEGSSRLRFSLTASIDSSEIDKLIQAIR